MSHIDRDKLKELVHGMKKYSDNSYSVVVEEQNKANRNVSDMKNIVGNLSFVSGGTVADAELSAVRSRVENLENDAIVIEKIENLPDVKLNSDITIEQIREAGYAQMVALRNLGNDIKNNIIDEEILGGISDVILSEVITNFQEVVDEVETCKAVIGDESSGLVYQVNTVNREIGNLKEEVDKLKQQGGSGGGWFPGGGSGSGESGGTNVTAGASIFTSNAVPTMDNYPAVEWTTTEIKDRRLGSVVYVINKELAENGNCYKFVKNNDVYSWVIVEDDNLLDAINQIIESNAKLTGLEDFKSETLAWIEQTNEGMQSVLVRMSGFEKDYASKEELLEETANSTNQAQQYINGLVEELNGKISVKVDISEFNTVKRTVDENSATISRLENDIIAGGSGEGGSVEVLKQTINQVKQTADSNTASITGLTKVVSDNKEAIETRTSTLEQTLDGFKTEVTDKFVTKENIDGAIQEASSSLKSEIEQSAGQIATNVAKEVTDSLSQRIDAAESSIQQNADSIKTKVSTSVTDALGQRIEAAESSIEQNATDITLKVSKDNVISSINASTEGIKISAEKITMSGTVTFESFDDATKEMINDKADSSEVPKNTSDLNNDSGFTTTGDVEIIAEDKASTAATTAANNAVAPVKSSIRTIEDVVLTTNKTEINGAKIATGSIKANAIKVDELFSQEVTATNLTVSGNSQITQATIGGFTLDGNILYTTASYSVDGLTGQFAFEINSNRYGVTNKTAPIKIYEAGASTPLFAVQWDGDVMARRITCSKLSAPTIDKCTALKIYNSSGSLAKTINANTEFGGAVVAATGSDTTTVSISSSTYANVKAFTTFSSSGSYFTKNSATKVTCNISGVYLIRARVLLKTNAGIINFTIYENGEISNPNNRRITRNSTNLYTMEYIVMSCDAGSYYEFKASLESGSSVDVVVANCTFVKL